MDTKREKWPLLTYCRERDSFDSDIWRRAFREERLDGVGPEGQGHNGEHGRSYNEEANLKRVENLHIGCVCETLT